MTTVIPSERSESRDLHLSSLPLAFQLKEPGSTAGFTGRGRISSFPSRAAGTGSTFISIHAIKVFDGPVERSLRPHGAIRLLPADPGKSGLRRSKSSEVTI